MNPWPTGTVLRNERDVEIIYDRRVRDQTELKPAVERRGRLDVEQRLRADGYAVVRMSNDDDAIGGNIRWPSSRRPPRHRR